jgi:hypothetical protein
MNELKKEDIKQEVFDLYDDYAHNRIGQTRIRPETFNVRSWRCNCCFAYELYDARLQKVVS